MHPAANMMMLCLSLGQDCDWSLAGPMSPYKAEEKLVQGERAGFIPGEVTMWVHTKHLALIALIAVIPANHLGTP